MKKQIIYYTDNTVTRETFYLLSQWYLHQAGLPIVSASLEPIFFGNDVVVKGERGYPTMVKQIISCLTRATSKYVFFCEHDVLYPKSHFDFTPHEDNIFYYNENVWRWMLGEDTVIRHDRMLPLSCMCANREFALDHFILRDKKIKENGWDKVKSREPKWARQMGYEPGTKKKKRGGITDDDFATWFSDKPVIDIRHKKTFTSPKTKLDQFKHPPKWWKRRAIDDIDGWDLRKLFNL